HGYFESGAELAILLDGVHALAGIAAGEHVGWQHEQGEGAVIGASNTTAQLIQIGEAEAVGAIDDNGVGVGNVDAAFDDGGSDQNVEFVANEAIHDVFEIVLVHLPVADGDARVGNEVLQFAAYAFDRSDAVVQEKYLPLALELAFQGGLDGA